MRGGKSHKDEIHGRDQGGVEEEQDDWEEEGLFKTNAVWRRCLKKEQEERVMNTRREGKVIVNL